jgi:hypothetical protein
VEETCRGGRQAGTLLEFTHLSCPRDKTQRAQEANRLKAPRILCDLIYLTALTVLYCGLNDVELVTLQILYSVGLEIIIICVTLNIHYGEE